MNSAKFVNAVEQTAQRAEQAGEIIRRLRQFVRKQPIKKSQLAMDQLVERSLRFIDAEARENMITTQVKIEGPLLPVMADRVQIEQVMLNLVRNSIEALVSSDNENRSLVIRLATIAKAHVQVTVEDNGPGLRKEQLEHVFDAFYTTKVNGMGMGLAISRSIIEAHGGRLWVEEDVSNGARFRFTLPITAV